MAKVLVKYEVWEGISFYLVYHHQLPYLLTVNCVRNLQFVNSNQALLYA
ncbi:unnamed protein product [Paramecium pentaurelia]|uniref:Uncharacterized protein n=1 Tax=Paramecium pentaurelia TaxID=43138 RepID=A0A8S1U2A3_9CILI|nr:unnamed protein product [Paramecium pentaurelia]